jgi:hypothetical protein
LGLSREKPWPTICVNSETDACVKAINEKSALKWLGDIGMPVGQYPTPSAFFHDIPFPHVASIRYTLPKKSGQKVALARHLFGHLEPKGETFVWLRNWNVFKSAGHIPLVTTLRRGMGCLERLEESPCHLFLENEIDDAISLLIVSLIFIWDCFVVDSDQRLMCFVSHDEYLVLMSKDQALLDKIGGVFESAKWGSKIQHT